MDDRRTSQIELIGLHKLADHCGDGLVPELYALMNDRARMPDDDANANVPAFPARSAPRFRNAVALEAKDNIVAFPAARPVAQK